MRVEIVRLIGQHLSKCFPLTAPGHATVIMMNRRQEGKQHCFEDPSQSQLKVNLRWQSDMNRPQHHYILPIKVLFILVEYCIMPL